MLHMDGGPSSDKYMAKPFPAPLLHLLGDVVDACPLPDFSVGDFLFPPDA